jgi:exodeoxyribonuclease V alpha subunit
MIANSKIGAARPETSEASELARRLVAALGETIDEYAMGVITAAYEAVLRGATCAEVAADAISLTAKFPSVFGACSVHDSEAPRPAQPIAITANKKGCLAYLRMMDDAEARVAWHIEKLNVDRTTAWPWNPSATHIAILGMDPEKFPAIEKLHRRRLLIATGGPGTGKTHLIKGLLACALKSGGVEESKIRLAAPTNRAADRMRRSIATTKGLERIPPAQTIHSLLGDADALAMAKLIIIDEVSMTDLSLVERLLRGMEHPEATLVLAGDPNQLPSVEVGSVLADLVKPGAFAESCVVQLEKNHRFEAGSFIAKLATAVRENDRATLSGDSMTRPFSRDELWDFLEGEEAPRAFSQIRELAGKRNVEEEVDEESMTKALVLLERQRVLCAHRVGPMGSTRLSGWILDKLGLKSREDDGAVIMINRNDHRLGVYNGDIGIVANGNAHFATATGLIRVGLSSIPDYDLAYASTIHKSQGSEYGRVAIVLGESQKEGFMSRELLYTGITRARKDVRLFESKGALEKCLGVKLNRASGLAERLGRRKI